MNKLSSQQRKLVYLVAIALLAIPIILLGAPAGQSGAADEAKADAAAAGGGVLAQMRRENDLGETNLGAVDPSSTTMNFVLFGLRGIAVNQLWMQALKNQKTKNWAQLKADVDSIILLQPHFVKVWEFQGWNLSYNVSGEWDLVEDKYYWIKEGAKFSIRGTKRNAKDAALFWWVGIILGDKISRHDAWMYMRKYFNPDAYKKDEDKDIRGDPDIRRKSGGSRIVPDPVLNPRGIDNYLVAKRWFQTANDKDRVRPQRRMARVAFRQRPARSQLAYAEMLQREGRFDEESTMIEAWRVGLDDWIKFGQEEYESGAGRTTVANSNMLKRVVNYNYWKTRAEVEMMPLTIQAHRRIFDGKAHLKVNEPSEAIKDLEIGLSLFAKLMKAHPELQTKDESVEEVMIGILAWRAARKQIIADVLENDLPGTNPPIVTKKGVDMLRDVWTRNQAGMQEYLRLFKREFPSQ